MVDIFVFHKLKNLTSHRQIQEKRASYWIGNLARISCFSYTFLIYISKVFDKIVEFNLRVTSLSFVNNLGFIASKLLVNNIAKIF